MTTVINQLATEVRAGTRNLIDAELMLGSLASLPFRRARDLIFKERQRLAYRECHDEAELAQEDADNIRFEAENVIDLRTPR